MLKEYRKARQKEIKMPQCNCSSLEKVVSEIVAKVAENNIEYAVEEITSYSMSTAITLALEVYKALPETNKESFLNAFSIKE